MDAATFQAIAALLTALIGTGGYAAYRNKKKSSDAGMPADEAEARQVLPQSEWLTRQVDSFLADSRNEMNELRKRLDKQDGRIAHQERERELDAEHIDELEAHIWQQLPPPPPPRRRQPREAKP